MHFRHSRRKQCKIYLYTLLIMSVNYTSPHKFRILGFLISNGFYLLIFALLYIPFSFADTESADISLIILAHILITTLMSAIAGYFWIKSTMSERLSHRLAPLNALITLLPFLVHPGLRTTFFLVFAVVVCFLCANLGVWFSRRFFV